MTGTLKAAHFLPITTTFPFFLSAFNFTYNVCVRTCARVALSCIVRRSLLHTSPLPVPIDSRLVRRGEMSGTCTTTFRNDRRTNWALILRWVPLFSLRRSRVHWLFLCVTWQRCWAASLKYSRTLRLWFLVSSPLKLYYHKLVFFCPPSFLWPILLNVAAAYWTVQMLTWLTIVYYWS